VRACCSVLSVLLIDHSSRSLSLWRTRDGHSIDSGTAAEQVFLAPADWAAAMAGDLLAYIKLSANNEAKLTLFFHERALINAHHGQAQPLQPLYLYVQHAHGAGPPGKKSAEAAALTAERHRLYAAIRDYGLMEQPNRRK